MTTALVAIAAATLCGLPLALRIDRGAPTARLAGEAMLIGLGLASGSLLLLSVAAIRWTLAAALLPMFVLGLASARRTAITWSAPHPLDAVTAIVLLAYARFATAAAPWELDFIDNWGLKGRVFALSGGIDWAFLGNPWYWWSHPDYPPLVPLGYSFLSLFSGGWSDRWLGLVNVAFAAGALLVVRSIAEEELESRRGGAVTALVMVWLFAIPWIGLADGPLVAYVVPALLLIRGGRISAGSVLLGLGASCKNEGLTFVLATLAAMAILPDFRHGIRRMWPAVAIPLPWLGLRWAHHLETDLTAGSMLGRALEHLRDPATYVNMLTAYAGGRPLLWLGIAIGAAAGFGALMRRERLLLLVAGLQTLFYVGAYVVTPLDVSFHIRWSWDRLVWHITSIVVVAVLLAALRTAEPGRAVTVDEQDGAAVQ